jgi:hypothetical protein
MAIVKNNLENGLKAIGLKEIKYSDTWPPSLELPEDGIELSDLASFAANVLVAGLGYSDAEEILAPFFTQLPQPTSVFLTRFEVDLDNNDSGTAFFVGFQLKHSWNIISDSGLPNVGSLVLSNPGFTIGSPGADTGFMVDIYGTLEIFGITLQVMLQWPAMIITGTLVRVLPLQALLAEVGFDGHVTFGDETEKLKIRALMLKIDCDKKAFDIIFRMGVWELLPGKLALINLLLDLSSGPGHKSARVRALLNLCNIDIDLSGVFHDGQIGFSGSTGAGQEIPIGELIAGIGRMFRSKPELPTQLKGLVIKDLGVSFNTRCKDFKFTCQVDLPVSAQSKLVTLLLINVKHTDEKGYQFEFSGNFDVRLEDKTLAFKIQFEHTKEADSRKTDKLIATYHHDGKLPLNISKLLCALVPGDSDLTALITGLDLAIDLKNVQLAFQKEASGEKADRSLFGMYLCADVSFSDPFSTGKELTAEINSILFASFDQKPAKQDGQKNATSKFLFGFTIGAELSLSSVPLVRAQLPAGKDIGVRDLQLFAASQSILPEDMEQLKGLFSSDKFPIPKTEDPAKPADKLEAGVTLDAVLILGAETRNLVLAPSNESPTSQENQGLPDSQLAESSSKAAGLAGENGKAEKALVTSDKSSTKWIKIQKSLGPVRFDRLGFTFQNQVIWFLVDASLSAAGLTISLQGFSFGSSITKFEPRFELQGLGLEFKNDPVEISGAFLKTGDYQYSGFALIKAKSFILSAIGSYSSVQGKDPSMFIFACLNMPLGGPPCFFVTGLAAGFGYNSTVRTPAIEEVEDFPLLAVMGNPSKSHNPMQILKELDHWILPQRGAYWLAAGISFQSFGIINSNVLAVAEFGKEFQVLVVGLSTLQLPKEGNIYAYVELAVQITIKPTEGFIAAMALVTPNSFLLDRACHLTGGFAFYIWFGNNPHAGDFVLTIGGYHPVFKVPAHYPQPIQVPRLGFNWAVSKNVTIKGEAYFALTPSCVMAGAKLDVLYHSGNLKAWLIAQADLIVYWKPFYFEASIRLTVGVSYRIKVWFIKKTLSVELGASLNLWGPPTGGLVHISLWFISFSVSFGTKKKTGLLTVDWNTFKTMLPQKENGRQAVLPPDLIVYNAGDPVPIDPDLAVIQINVNNGLLQQVDGQNGRTLWIVFPDEFTFSIETTIPVTETCWNNGESEATNNQNTSASHDKKEQPEIGIRPMGIKSVTSPLRISIHKGAETISEWDYEPHIRQIPEAMWGQPVTGHLQPEAKLIENCTVGIQNIRQKPHEDPSGPPKFMMEDAFTYFTINRKDGSIPDALPLCPTDTEPATGFPTANDTLQVIHATLMEVKQQKQRTSVFDALKVMGVNAGTDGDLSILAANPAANYEASPMEMALV